jgi:hypothetical protein
LLLLFGEEKQSASSFILQPSSIVHRRLSPAKVRAGMTATATDAFTQEVQAVFRGWTEKWNAGDLEGYLAAYADSDQTRVCGGSKVIRGKEKSAAHYREQGGASGQLSVVEFEAQGIGGIEGLNVNDGLVFGQFELVLEDGTRHTGAFTVHVQKIDGLWRILSDHSAY